MLNKLLDKKVIIEGSAAIPVPTPEGVALISPQTKATLKGFNDTMLAVVVDGEMEESFMPLANVKRVGPVPSDLLAGRPPLSLPKR